MPEVLIGDVAGSRDLKNIYRGQLIYGTLQRAQTPDSGQIRPLFRLIFEGIIQFGHRL